MTAKIYDFDAEKIKRMSIAYDFGEGDETVMFTQISDVPPQMSTEALDKLLKDIGVSCHDE